MPRSSAAVGCAVATFDSSKIYILIFHRGSLKNLTPIFSAIIVTLVQGIPTDAHNTTSTITIPVLIVRGLSILKHGDLLL